MRLVHRERWWSWAATAGVVTVGLAWSAGPPASPWVAVAYWAGFTTAMIGVAATYKAYGRRTAPLPVIIGLDQCTSYSQPGNAAVRCIMLAGHDQTEHGPAGHNYGGLHPHSHRNITRLLASRTGDDR